MRIRRGTGQHFPVQNDGSHQDGSIADTGEDGCSSNGKIEMELQSYCEVGRIARLFAYFDERKRGLVTSMGFDGLLRMPHIDLLDDNFSFWLMKHLNPETMTLCLPNGQSLKVTDLDAHFVLGIPFKGQQVIHDNQHDKVVVSTVLSKISIKGKPAALTLEYLEWILLKDYGAHIHCHEKEAFRIAVVLYSMACFLAVQKPKIAFPMWLLSNFTGTNKIEEINWSGYVLSVLAHAAMQVQCQLSQGDDIIKLYGCTFLLQIMYLDNLNFGVASPVHMDLPRGSAYNAEFMKHLIKMDKEKGQSRVALGYGTHQLRGSAEVCYTRGWDEESKNDSKDHEKDYVSASELFHQIIKYDEKLAESLSPSLSKLSAYTSWDIRRTYKTWFPGYTATFSALPKGHFFQSSNSTPPKRKETKSADQGNSPLSALKMLATQATKDDVDLTKRRKLDMQPSESSNNANEFVLEDGVLKKVVKEHSKFTKSPFELYRFMQSIPYKKKCILFAWIQKELKCWGDLTSVWVRIDYPTPISLLGYSLKSQLSIDGAFTPAMVDAITRTSMIYDEVAYGETGPRWRHYLPSRFAEAVLRGEPYLESEEIRAHFTGHHIKYPVENCRMIIAPVYYQGRWSCYFWDFKRRRITVLDPTKMLMLPLDVEVQHGDLVDDLTSALWSCIDKFFSGWEFNRTRWQQLYPTNHGPPARICNSGMYSILYSRFFDGGKLVCVPEQGRLIEPRSGLLYHLLTLKDNLGHIPPNIKDMVLKIR